MPWASIISFLLTFFLSKSQGASNGKAAALGAAVGLGTYYLADPANPDNLLGIGVTAKKTPGSTLVDKGGTVPDNGGGNGAGGVIKTGISEAGSVLRSWGPVGTLGVVAGTSAISSANSSSAPSWLKWALIGGVAYLLLK